MKQILIISGKGGTGKTILTASFAVLAQERVMVDCDVDAADLHLLLHPKVVEDNEFRSGKTAKIKSDLCTQCGECLRVCRFDAISDDFIIDETGCEGCSLCANICPEKAIIMEENLAGKWFVSNTAYGPLVHARLGIAEENSGKLVSKVREEAHNIAKRDGLDYVIIDGPPGIGCPVIASLSGVDLALIVTEPTLSGIHDMERVIELANHFKIKCGVVINKFDINNSNTQRIEQFCSGKGVEIFAKLPFSRDVVESLAAGRPVVIKNKSKISEKIRKLWERLK